MSDENAGWTVAEAEAEADYLDELAALGARSRGDRADPPHTCHARDCTAQVPPRMFMHRAHWFALPKGMRDEIWATYRPGQETAKDPSPAYLEAARAAIEFIARKEGLQ